MLNKSVDVKDTVLLGANVDAFICKWIWSWFAELSVLLHMCLSLHFSPSSYSSLSCGSSLLRVSKVLLWTCTISSKWKNPTFLLPSAESEHFALFLFWCLCLLPLISFAYLTKVWFFFSSCFKMLIIDYLSLNNQVQEQFLFPIWMMTLGIQMIHHVKLISCVFVNFILYSIANFKGFL